MRTVIEFPKILIGAVNGPAVGVGATLLLHMDVVVAWESATAWMPFARIAVVPEFCSTRLLPARVGASLAGEMLYAQAKISASTAASAGWFSSVVSGSDGSGVLPRALEIASSMLAPPLALSSLSLFKSMVHASSPTPPSLLVSICESELHALDARLSSGDTLTAALALQQQRTTSKL